MTGHGEGVAFAQRVAVLGPRAKPALSPRGSKREPCAGPRAQDGGGDAVTHSFTVQTLPEPLLPAWCCTTQHNGKNNGVCVCVCMYMCVCAPHRARHTLRIIGKNNGVHVCVCVCVVCGVCGVWCICVSVCVCVVSAYVRGVYCMCVHVCVCMCVVCVHVCVCMCVVCVCMCMQCV